MSINPNKTASTNPWQILKDVVMKGLTLAAALALRDAFQQGFDILLPNTDPVSILWKNTAQFIIMTVLVICFILAFPPVNIW